ncbi:MAG: LON peptidase substrate-binding domain-containing protein [Chloroflexi bacterium]|nr:LON peptidase substrate-binding domain-containing protein [Chloroflexota bacterium]
MRGIIAGLLFMGAMIVSAHEQGQTGLLPGTVWRERSNSGDLHVGTRVWPHGFHQAPGEESRLAALPPLFPLGTVLFPGMALPLHIFEQRYRTMIARRMNEDPMFGVVLTRSGREVGDRPEIHAVGTAASLLEAVRYSDGRFDIAVRGGRRFRVIGGNWDEDYLTGMVEWLADADPVTSGGQDATRLSEQVRLAFDAYLKAFERRAGIRVERAELGHDPGGIGYAICSMMPFDAPKRQRLLEAPDPESLLEDLLGMLRRERELLVSTGIGGANIDHPGTRFSTN